CINSRLLALHAGAATDAEFEFLIPWTGIVHFTKNTKGPAALHRVRESLAKSNSEPSQTAGIVTAPSHFRTEQFGSLLVGLLAVLSSSSDEFLPRIEDGKDVLSTVINGMYLILHVIFELGRNTF